MTHTHTNTHTHTHILLYIYRCRSCQILILQINICHEAISNMALGQISKCYYFAINRDFLTEIELLRIMRRLCM